MKSILSLLFGLLFIFTSLMLSAQIIYVPQDYPTIQTAINSAVENDTVLVSQGVYYENINFNGKNIVLCSNFAFSGNTDDISSTIINGSMPMHADTGSCVLIVSGEDSTAVLQGFTITAGTGTRWEDEHGANLWYTEGGGILIQYSSPTIKNNIITENEAINVPAGTASAGGGGIRCGDGNPYIINNIISNNQGRYGGGIVMNYSGANIKNNIITGNSGGEDFGGGGLWFLFNGEKPLILENNTIVYNSSALGGGGLRVWFCTASVVNNIFWGNTANYSTAQIQGNAQVIYCCIEGGYSGEGNIESNPLFVDGSLVLNDNSSCIDAGNSNESYNDPQDIFIPGYALYPAKGTLHSDIGVYGGPGCTILPDIITAIEQPVEDSMRMTVNVFPNPASSNISIEIKVDHESTVEIQICDTNSVIRKIGSRHLLNNDFYKFVSDISNLSPGIYFITIRSTDEVKVHKFIKI